MGNSNSAVAALSDKTENESSTPTSEVEKCQSDFKELRAQTNARIAKPLADLTPDELARMGEDYARKHHIGDEEDIRAFRLGAVLASKKPEEYAEVEGLTADEQAVLEREITHKWSHPRLLYLVMILCSVCAAVQGMDETVVNGAQIFYSKQFGIDDPNSSRDSWLLGLVNSAPYLCCALIGCWLTDPLNNLLGRRGTVFATCCISAAACIWQGFTDNWWHLFLARFMLGFGIGPKSATVPIYAAECSPPRIRGALVMQWQVWSMSPQQSCELCMLTLNSCLRYHGWLCC